MMNDIPRDSTRREPAPDGSHRDSVGPDSVRIEDCARRLESLVRDSLDFLLRQFDRLSETSNERATEVSASAAVAQLREEWRDERAAWERYQANEEARIEDQLDQLNEAWKALEIEQRRLMIEEPIGVKPLEGTSGQAGETRHHSALDLIEERVPSGSSSAAIQFQKLKREIRQQARRTH